MADFQAMKDSETFIELEMLWRERGHYSATMKWLHEVLQPAPREEAGPLPDELHIHAGLYAVQIRYLWP